MSTKLPKLWMHLWDSVDETATAVGVSSYDPLLPVRSHPVNDRYVTGTDCCDGNPRRRKWRSTEVDGVLGDRLIFGAKVAAGGQIRLRPQ